MWHTVQPGESLSQIAGQYLGEPGRWVDIARLNELGPPYQLIVGQRLRLPADARASDQFGPSARPSSDTVSEKLSLVPGQAYVFVLADEINPFTKKIVRRVVVSPAMAAEAARTVGKPISIFPNPERFGFSATDPASNLSIGRHAQGIKPSPFVSGSTAPLGARRFTGKPFWIDVAAAKQAGATIHTTEEIISDLDRIIGKTKDAAGVERLRAIQQLVAQDAEVLIKGEIPAGAVKGPGAMALTRGLQGIQIVGFVMTAAQLTAAGKESVETGSAKPLVAETVRAAGGWGAAWVGIKLGAAGGALLGIETGPGAVVTGVIGGVVGGVAGYFGFDWVADHIHEN